MPFAPDSYHTSTFTVQNKDTATHVFKIEAYWYYGLGSNSWQATLTPNSSMGCGGGEQMPHEPGIYDMTAKVWVDDVYAGEFTVSKVRVAQYYQPGDANQDGVINMADVTKVERIVLGLAPPTLEADANQDGEINMGDVTKIERIILGIDPIPEPVPVR